MSWLLVLVMLALWSLFVWVVHGVGMWSATQVGAMAGQGPSIDALTAPAWLPAEWLTAFKAVAQAVLPWVDSALSLVPSLAGALTVLSWVVWAGGGMLLLLLGVALHGLIALWRSHRRPPGGGLPAAHVPVH